VVVGHHPGDVLVLQSKPAERFVLAPSLQTHAPVHQGERVVRAPHLMQTSSAAIHGWTTTTEGHHL
jgi:hypothetical protein